MDQKAAELLIRGYRKERLTKDDCRYLLSFQEFSPEATFARDLFVRFFREQCDNTASIGAQIGVYTGPCSGDCKFCNFGASHTSSKLYEMPDDIFRSYLERCIEFGDVSHVYIMTNQDCPCEALAHYIGMAKDILPKDVTVGINTGDRTPEECRALRDAGATDAYHVCRMGEGIDTAFRSEDRMRTISNLIDAGFSVSTCTEPVGAEHSTDDIIDNYFRGIEAGCSCGFVALRMPVFGTPLGSVPTLSIKRYKQMQAVLGLASAWHPGGKETTGWDTGFFVGLNSLSAEFAGSPRDSAPFSEKSVGHTLEWCRRTLFGDGYDKIRKADGFVVPLDLDYLVNTRSL